MSDWLTTFESMVFGGVELGREPIDCSMEQKGGRPQTVELTSL